MVNFHNPQAAFEEFDLDLVLNVDQDVIDLGRSEGHISGLAKAEADGADLGVLKGMELGVELGFYRGVCLRLLERLSSGDDDGKNDIVSSLPAEKVEKVKLNCQAMVAIVDAFPRINMASPDIDDAADAGADDDNEVGDTEEATTSIPNTVQQLQLCRSKFKVLTLMLKIPNFTLATVLAHDDSNEKKSSVGSTSKKVVSKTPTTEW